MISTSCLEIQRFKVLCKDVRVEISIVLTNINKTINSELIEKKPIRSIQEILSFKGLQDGSEQKSQVLTGYNLAT